jgi:7-cyano-7-deazaguanine synthase
MKKKAVVLLSGGLDSTTTLAMAKELGFDAYALTFNYGQRHDLEIEASRRVAGAFDVKEHIVANLDLRLFGGSALTSEIEVPKDRSHSDMSEGIPVTYVPARNTIFLSLALGWAEVIGSEDIFIGVNAIDYSGYPDCRPEFIQAYQEMANLATRAGVEGAQRLTIHTPLLQMSKADIVRKGTSLGVDYSVTTTCYDPRPEGACGRCDACQLRLQGFADAGLTDPILYRDGRRDLA